jgi:succinate dehydrogenase / fumarate reductase cytochrome b subunit
MATPAAVSGGRPAARAACRVGAFWQSTIGKKIVMAVTGVIMVAWVVLHMLGNLQIFAGAARLNGYSAFLHHSIGELLWLMRGILFVAVVLHIIAAAQLTRIDHDARPVKYARKEPQTATVASRSMRWGGVALFLFIVFHVLHITTGIIRPAPFVEGDVYGNLVGSFRIWWVTLIYVAAMIALGLHMYHGVWSSVRTLGLNRPSPNPLRRRVATGLAILLWGGFSLVPIAILLGWVR